MRPPRLHPVQRMENFYAKGKSMMAKMASSRRAADELGGVKEVEAASERQDTSFLRPATCRSE
jgi:hypothetical protein